jgi:hypothetical protein
MAIQTAPNCSIPGRIDTGLSTVLSTVLGTGTPTRVIAIAVDVCAPSAILSSLALVSFVIGIILEAQDFFILWDMMPQELGNLLLGLQQGPSQDAAKGLVGLGEERSGQATVTDAAGAS